MGVLKPEALQETQKPLIVSREANVFSVLFTVVFFSVFPRELSHVGSRLQALLCFVNVLAAGFADARGF